MSIEENIELLKSQKKMAESYIRIHEDNLRELENTLSVIDRELNKTRESIRIIKRELTSDDREVSSEVIERRIRLRSQVKFYSQVLNDLDELKDSIGNFVPRWQHVLLREDSLPKGIYSAMDLLKIEYMNNSLRHYLKAFGYSSKTINRIYISQDKLIPSVTSDGTNYNLRFDSSASDLGRAIIAFVCALYDASKSFSCNHPGFIMLDEPASQEMSNASLNSVFRVLESHRDQSIVFASFNESDYDYAETTLDIRHNLIHLKGRKSIAPIP